MGECTEAGGRRLHGSFTSASTVRGFVKNVPDTDLSHVQGICIGKQTAQEAKKAGISCVTAKSATVENLVQTILNCSSQSDGNKVL